jgi:hypothetical protein
MEIKRGNARGRYKKNLRNRNEDHGPLGYNAAQFGESQTPRSKINILTMQEVRKTGVLLPCASFNNTGGQYSD